MASVRAGGTRGRSPIRRADPRACRADAGGRAAVLTGLALGADETALQLRRRRRMPLACAALPARAVRGPRAPAFQRLGAGDLHPPLLRVELLRVAAAEHFESEVGIALEIDIALRVEMGEPGRRDEIGYQDSIDRIGVLVVLHRIADLGGPEHALRILVGAVEP